MWESLHFLNEKVYIITCGLVELCKTYPSFVRYVQFERQQNNFVPKYFHKQNWNGIPSMNLLFGNDLHILEVLLFIL